MRNQKKKSAKEIAKLRAKAAKLSNPRPVELPSGMFRCQKMVNGERISVIDEDPAVAHAKILAIEAGIYEKQKPVADLTVGEAIDRYIESKDSILSPTTIRSYKAIRKYQFRELMGLKLSALSQEAVQRAVNKMARDKSPKTVKNAHGLLSATVAAYRPDMILKTTLPQKVKHEIQIPTIEEIQMLAAAVQGTRFELAFLLAIWLGLRTSEIRGITWDCISGNVLHIRQALVEGEDGPVLKSTKSYSGDRKITLPPYIKDLIDQQPRNSEYVVTYTRNAMYNHFVRLCDRLGIQRYRFHDLRHVQASVMLRLGIPDKYAMERMGHASPNMLKNVYQHTMTDNAAEVSEAVDLYFSEKLGR